MKNMKDMKNMNNMQIENEFLTYAYKFGITKKEIENESFISKRTGGNTIQELREKVSLATVSMRQERAETFFDNIKARSRMGQGIHDRLEAYAFADGEFSDYDIAGMNRHVPIPILFTCVKELTLDSNECLDLTADAADWNRGKGDDIISIFNVHTLNLKKNAKIRVRGNIFVMLCQNLINDGGCLQIMPTDFSYEKSYIGKMNGNDGKNGENGTAPVSNLQLPMTSTLFGDFYEGPIRGVQNGRNGNDGKDGAPGQNGFCGGALKIAEINIRNIAGKPLSILISGGCGGNGGNGGKGGDGSSGTDGGKPYRTFSEIFPGGKGGDGGNGGNGGNGGRGGNGGISSNVYIEVPNPQMLDVTVLPGYGGNGGKGGKGGKGGEGGRSYEIESMNGHDGACGMEGKAGKSGRTRQPSAVFVCGKRLLYSEEK